MPTDVAEHLDAVIVSESVLRASTVGVHSLAQIREEPRRHLPKLLGAAAAVVLVAAIGVGVVITTKDQASDNAADTNPTAPADRRADDEHERHRPEGPALAGEQHEPVLHGSATELACARVFAAGRPNPQLRLVQPAKVDGKRARSIGLQGGSARDIQVFAVTGCSDPGGVASSFYDTTVTLRNR